MGPPHEVLAALFGRSDDQMLTGRASEPAWWDVVAARLGAGPEMTAELRRDLAARERCNDVLVAFLRGLRGQAGTAIVSNAWPGTRIRMAETGLLDIADEIVLPCDNGFARPPGSTPGRLRRLAAEPGAALFVDDTPAQVAAAQALGLTGHVHTSTASTTARITDFLRG